MRSRANTVWSATFKLKLNQDQILQHNPNMQEKFYILIQRDNPQKDANQQQVAYPIEEFQLDEENKESQIYQATIPVLPNTIYGYKYCRKINDNKIEENCFRGYQFSRNDPLKVDEWNKQWCRYIFNYTDENQNIFLGYKAFIKKETDMKEKIKLEQVTSIQMSCEEQINLDSNHPKNRQLCFSQIQPELGVQPIRRKSIKIQLNPEEKQMIAESLNIVKVTTLKKFSSNVISVEYKGIDDNMKKRMENYSMLFDQAKSLYNEVKSLQQELQIVKSQNGQRQNLQEMENYYENKLKELESQNEIDRIRQEQDKYQQILKINLDHQNEMEAFISDNQKNLEQLKKQKEIEFDEFKNYSEKTIKKYIEQYEEAYQKMLKLEFNKVNFSSEEIIIQADDINQLSIEDQNNLQELQKRLKIYESKVTEMKEENECIQEKYKKHNFQIKQKCMSSIHELKKCQELLEKCQNDSNIFRQENQIEKDNIEQKLNQYQSALKNFKEKLKKKEDDLISYQKALEDLEQKYLEEKEQNNKLKVEFQSFAQQQKQKLDQQFDQFQDQLQQQQENFEKKQNEINEQGKDNLSKMIDFKTELEYEKINKMPLKNSNYKNFIYFILQKYPKQKQILDAYQQSQQIIQEISTHLIQLQEYKIKNLKDLGVQIISDLQSNYFNSNAFENLPYEKLQKQIIKLSVILNYIYQDQSERNEESKDIQDIADLEQLKNQLQETLTIIMQQQQDKKQYQDKKKYKNWFMYVPVLIIIVFVLYQNVSI